MDAADRVGMGGAVDHRGFVLHAETPGAHVVIEPEIKHEVFILAIVDAGIKGCLWGKLA